MVTVTVTCCGPRPGPRRSRDQHAEAASGRLDIRVRSSGERSELERMRVTLAVGTTEVASREASCEKSVVSGRPGARQPSELREGRTRPRRSQKDRVQIESPAREFCCPVHHTVSLYGKKHHCYLMFYKLRSGPFMWRHI